MMMNNPVWPRLVCGSSEVKDQREGRQGSECRGSWKAFEGAGLYLIIE